LPKQKAGRLAVELLLGLLDDPDPGSIRLRGTLHGELMVRGSTGVARVKEQE
jgi:DNA-binding LacI/PurR family transcriptional regulator